MHVIVIGRGHGGTRLASQTLSESGVYMGPVNESGDLVPPDLLYKAVKLASPYVIHQGAHFWDFSKLIGSEPPEDFQKLVRQYLEPVFSRKSEHHGWKLPESVLALPWILKMFPEAHYIYWYREFKGNTAGYHNTDDLRKFGIPCEGTKPESWMYQRKLMLATPPPKNCFHVDYERFVQDQDMVLKPLQDFLGIPLVKVPVFESMLSV